MTITPRMVYDRFGQFYEGCLVAPHVLVDYSLDFEYLKEIAGNSLYNKPPRGFSVFELKNLRPGIRMHVTHERVFCNTTYTLPFRRERLLYETLRDIRIKQHFGEDALYIYECFYITSKCLWTNPAERRGVWKELSDFDELEKVVRPYRNRSA